MPKGEYKNKTKSEYYAQYYAKNREKKLASRKVYYYKNRESEIQKSVSYNSLHKEEKRIKDSERYKNNKKVILEKTRNYYYENKETCILRSLKYKIRKLKAFPKWLSEEQLNQIKQFYELAKECEILTGDKYHVDHIVPLKGKNVCGLHVPWNLQVLPADVNLKKGNRL